MLLSPVATTKPGTASTGLTWTRTSPSTICWRGGGRVRVRTPCKNGCGPEVAGSREGLSRRLVLPGAPRSRGTRARLHGGRGTAPARGHAACWKRRPCSGAALRTTGRIVRIRATETYGTTNLPLWGARLAQTLEQFLAPCLRRIDLPLIQLLAQALQLLRLFRTDARRFVLRDQLAQRGGALSGSRIGVAGPPALEFLSEPLDQVAQSLLFLLRQAGGCRRTHGARCTIGRRSR